MKFIYLIAAIFIFILGNSCQNFQNGKEENQVQSDTIAENQTLVKVDIKKNQSKTEVKTNSKKPVGAKNNKNQKYPTSKKTDKYRLRKYENVSRFYYQIARPATELCMENNVPPAAILAIAGLESGWNQGYVGRISGNILSLGTRGGDTELPALRLPRVKSTDKILFDSLEIIKYSEQELIWEERPPSLKKDYRPEPWAGTTYNLAYFKYHPEEKAKAQIANMNDFVTVFISRTSRIKAYRKGRQLMDSLVSVHGKQILLQESTAIKFIHEIGGKQNSYNFRKTWPKKVIKIVKKAGLENLTTEIYNTNKGFNEIW